MKRLILSLLILLTSMSAWAYDFEAKNADGVTIYYNLLSATECEVTSHNYSGDIVIPSTVDYKGKSLSVTTIGYGAFYSGFYITSITIPSSVTEIGQFAFFCCYNLTSITIPNSVITIRKWAFDGCSSLTSITIPNSVSTIEEYAFSGCSSLTSVTIPNSVSTIGYGVFSGCSSLTSVTIPNSVITIGNGAFNGCSSLNSITIPNSVSTIGQFAFYGCSNLVSIAIPNSVTEIGKAAFSDCSSLEKVKMYCYNPPKAGDNQEAPFDYTGKVITKTLEVPQGSKSKYQQAMAWKDFWEIVEFDANDEQPIDPEQKVCAKPTIKYADGHIDFGCETEVVKFISQITDADAKSYDTSSINLTGNITISVYATKEGYSNSETATATLCWLNVTNPGQSLTSIQSRPAIIAPSTDGYSIEMDPEDAQAVGNRVEFYTPQGTYLGAEQLRDGRAFFETNEPLVIIRIGSQSLKVSR